jgi:hypothetical protein
VVRELRQSITLSVANGHQIRRLVEFPVQYERVSNHVAEHGAILRPTNKKAKIGQWNPYWVVMRQANEDIRSLEAELGSAPTRRGNATKVNRGKKTSRGQRTNSSDLFPNDLTSQYADDALAGKIIAGEHQLGSCGTSPPRSEGRASPWHSTGDVAHASRAQRFPPAMLTISEGAYVGLPFTLLPWHSIRRRLAVRLAERQWSHALPVGMAGNRQGTGQKPADGGDRPLHDGLVRYPPVEGVCHRPGPQDGQRPVQGRGVDVPRQHPRYGRGRRGFPGAARRGHHSRRARQRIQDRAPGHGIDLPSPCQW